MPICVICSDPLLTTESSVTIPCSTKRCHIKCASELTVEKCSICEGYHTALLLNQLYNFADLDRQFIEYVQRNPRAHKAEKYAAEVAQCRIEEKDPNITTLEGYDEYGEPEDEYPEGYDYPDEEDAWWN